MLNFVRFFSNENDANSFAVANNGIVNIIYDWSYETNSIIKEFKVTY